MGYSKLTYEEYIASPKGWGFPLPKWADKLSDKGYRGICAIDFYDDIFGEDLEEHRMPEDYRSGEYGGIAVERTPQFYPSGLPKLNKSGQQDYRGKRYTITQGNGELYDLIEQSENFCMISPISYIGKSRVIENARYLYALCIEVDYIEPKNGIDELVYSWERDYKPVPKPTYIVCSGSGLHLYYVFERPLPLWKNVYISLNEAKKYLTQRLWTKFVTTAYENIQYESLNQPFRCVGTITKKGSYAMAFEVGEKVSIEYMNRFLPEDKKIERFYKASCTLAEAKELYPDWYQKRIVEDKERGHYNRHKPIYFNWIEKILEGAEVGKRYNCLENLCSLAVQCQIAPEQVEKDCRMVADRLERLTTSEDNHFTEYDILCALKTYYLADEKAYRRRTEFISKKTGITLTPNKRNGRKREQHLERARAVQKIDYPNYEWAGRPDKANIVEEWRKAHPEGRKADCIRDTGLSKMTVYKWWNEKTESR
uniref:Uncharacterized protein n=1 Tax=uncultured prokaryote TaxID=198431 RepID=A0A0H5Q659_9ZZZZ|nr:hypothetical protein [uncultured prokaryote]